MNFIVSDTAEVSILTECSLVCRILTEVYEDKSECVRDSRGLHSPCSLVCRKLTQVYEDKPECVRDSRGTDRGL